MCLMCLMCLFVADLEETMGTSFAIAPFHDRRFDDFRNEGFSEVTDFRMDADRRSEWTTVPTNHNLVAVLLDFGRAADCFQHSHRALHTALEARIASSGSSIRCNRAPDFPQHTFDLHRRQTIFQYGDQLVKQSVVRFRKKFVGFVGQDVGEVRLARTAAQSALAYEPVALECREMRAHGVVSEV